jgi:hypothetical protein
LRSILDILRSAAAVNARRSLQLLVVLLIGAAAVWIAMNTYWDYVTVDNPPTGEAARNRYYTFEHLTQKLGIHTRQVPTLRALPAMDGVLFVDDLRVTDLHNRIDALKAWVIGGGRLLLSRNALLSNRELQSWTGLGIARPGPDDEDRAAGALHRAAGPDADCATYSERLAGRETGRTRRACLGMLRAAFSSTRPPAWSLSNGYGFQMLRVDIGKGSVAVISCECLVGNKSLLREDHARIVLDSIPLRSGDHVDILDPVAAESLLALLWRHAAAAIVCGLGAIALTIWRNLPRFGPVAAPPPPLRRSLAEQLRATARFAWRTRRLASLRRAECQALTQSACRMLASYEGMDAAQRIDALAAQTGLDSGALRDALSENIDGGAESQRAAIMLLEKARRRLIPPVLKSQGARA